MTLYIYEHCPYCVRVLMFIHANKIDMNIIVVSNDDVETPTQLIGKKMLPILVKENGEAMPESLDIIQYLDGLNGSTLGELVIDPAINAWLGESSAVRRPLVRPRMVLHPFPEFQTESAKAYFIHKKFGSRDVMDDYLNNSEHYAENLSSHWPSLIDMINRWPAGALTWNDIALFPMLRGLSLYESLVVPDVIYDYMIRVAELSSLPLFHLPSRLG